MIEMRVYKDEVGVRIDFRCESDEFDYSDYVTTNADLKVWDNKDGLILFMHSALMKLMAVIDDQFLHEQLMERKEAADGSQGTSVPPDER